MLRRLGRFSCCSPFTNVPWTAALLAAVRDYRMSFDHMLLVELGACLTTKPPENSFLPSVLSPRRSNSGWRVLHHSALGQTIPSMVRGIDILLVSTPAAPKAQ